MGKDLIKYHLSFIHSSLVSASSWSNTATQCKYKYDMIHSCVKEPHATTYTSKALFITTQKRVYYLMDVQHDNKYAFTWNTL